MFKYESFIIHQSFISLSHPLICRLYLLVMNDSLVLSMAIFDRINALLTNSSSHMKTVYQQFVVLILSSLILTGCFGPDSPQDVAQEFWKSVITEQVDDVIEYSTLLDANNYNSFNQKWGGYQVVIGKIMINGNLAEVETTLSHINHSSETQKKLTTYLIKQDTNWMVDYARTAKSLEGDAFSHLLGQINQLGQNLSDTLLESSEKFNIEMQRLENELTLLADSTSNEVNKILEQHGTELKKQIEELANSIDRALKEHNDDLSEEDKGKLLKVSDELIQSQQYLSEPTVGNIKQSNRHLIQIQQQLDEISNESITDYRKQWRNWQNSFESEMQSLLNALSQ